MATGHIRLTSHHDPHLPAAPRIQWGDPDPARRGPVIATLTDPERRNAIGTHGGAYSVYRAMAVASGRLDPSFRTDLTDTAPTAVIGPHPQWGDPEKIVALDPWGAQVAAVFSDWLQQGYDVRPTIAITEGHLALPELQDAVEAGRLIPDGNLLHPSGTCRVTKVAVESVWFLPGLAARFDIPEAELRRGLFEQTGGMFPELVTRPDLAVFLPPIGGHTIYLFGDALTVSDPEIPLAVRIHDECSGSDVFGSDICTCRPYLTHAVEVCVDTALRGGAGAIVYNRKEGRALGEVTKFLVYNARKRQAGGDRAESYFLRTECVAGVQDARFQILMPDLLHWLGVTRIQRLVSMSNDKYEALIAAGIAVDERMTLPESMVPNDARVELDAKVSSGYFTAGPVPDADELAKPKGRPLSR
jgi:GTP cyclohydrolase II